MEPKEKRNKEVHTATVFLPAGTKVRHLQTGESVLVPEDTKVFGWYLLEKMQWFYWTVFMEDPIRGEYLAMVRRDKVAMVSGTHRVVHREVIQKRMTKLLRKGSLENTVLPTPPKPTDKVRGRIEHLEPEWREMYIRLFSLSSSMYGNKVSWTEERREKFVASMKKVYEAKKAANIPWSQSLPKEEEKDEEEEV